MPKIPARYGLNVHVNKFAEVIIAQEQAMGEEQAVIVNVDDVPRLIEFLQSAAQDARELINAGEAEEL